jgi:hypothetical protein
MVPSAILVLAAMPMTVSGKIDRKSLPMPSMVQDQPPTFVEAVTASEQRVALCWTKFLGVKCSLDADFFTIGGHSLLAIMIVSDLRETCPSLSVAHFMMHRTIQQLAHQMDALNCANLVPTSQPLTWGLSAAEGSVCLLPIRVLVQACGISLPLLVVTASLTPVAMLYLWLSDRFGGTSALCFAPLLCLLFLIICLHTVVVLKWVIIGRFRPGVYRIWSPYFLRWWAVQRLLALVSPALMLMRETKLLVWYYRLLGCRIGDDVILDSTAIEADLVSIGSHSVVEEQASLLTHTFEQGCLVLGPVEVGTGCIVGRNACMMPNSVLCPDSELAPMSVAASFTSLGSEFRWIGFPPMATLLQTSTEMRMRDRRRIAGHWSSDILHLVGLLFMLTLLLAPILGGTFLLQTLDILPTVIILYVATPVSLLVVIVVVKWLLVGKVTAGRFQLTLGLCFRHWLVNRLLTSIYPMAMSIYFSTWIENAVLRALGMRIARNVSTAGIIAHSDLDLVTVKEQQFFGSATSFYCSRYDGNFIERLPTFVGGHGGLIANYCVLDTGANIGDNVTLGSLSLVDAEQVLPSNSIWVGVSAKKMSAFSFVSDDLVDFQQLAETRRSMQVQQLSSSPRESESVDPDITIITPLLHTENRHSPIDEVAASDLYANFGWYQLAQTFFVCLQVLLPGLSLYVAAAMSNLLASAGVNYVVIRVPLCYCIYCWSLVMLLMILKAIGGRFKGAHSLFGVYFLYWDFMKVMIALLDTIFFRYIEGTVFMAAFIRLFGGKIGSNVFWDAQFPFEAENMVIGADAVVSNGADIIAHVVDHGHLQVIQLSTLMVTISYLHHTS